MSRVSFFTPIRYDRYPAPSLSQKLLGMADNYFHLTGKVAHVIAGRESGTQKGCVLLKEESSWQKTIIKIISYCTILLPLIAFVAKCILRMAYRFYFIDVKQELQGGLEITPAVHTQIQRVMTFISHHPHRRMPADVENQIQWLNRTKTVFTLANIPHLVFKMGLNNASLMEHYNNIIKGKEVCLARKLDLLQIPRTTLLHLPLERETNTLIVQERLDHALAHHSMQEERHHDFRSSIYPALIQLVTFIAKTQFSSLKDWRNIPIADQENRRIALVSLKKMDNAQRGIYGDGHNRGVLRSLFSEQHMQRIIGAATSLDIPSPHADQEASLIRERNEELASYEALSIFHERNALIQNSARPIQVLDLASLRLPLEESSMIEAPSGITINGSTQIQWHNRPTSMRDVVIATIEEINRQITRNHQMTERAYTASVKGKRSLYIPTSNHFFVLYGHLGASANETSPENMGLPEERWIYKILQAFKQQGAIFSFGVNRLGRNKGYYIQA